MQANNSIMCKYFYIGFIDYVLAGKILIGYTSLFLAYDFNKSGKTILNYIEKNNKQLIFVKMILQYKKLIEHLVYIQI